MIPLPPPVAAVERAATLPDTNLWYWDTGGNGEPIVLMHAHSGSSLSWGYQQPAFAAAGYRVIAYSRRGFYRSDPAPADLPGTNSGDLHRFAEYLGLERFHVIATAAGVQFTLDYALSHPERLGSMVLACGIGGVIDADYRDMRRRVIPPDFDTYPVSFRELGPSYRAENPEGTRLFEETHRRSRTGTILRPQANQITWAALQTLNLPTLLIAGDADLYAPPAMVRKIAEHITGSDFVAVAEAGHSVFWEQPDVFNRLALDFIGRHHRS